MKEKVMHVVFAVAALTSILAVALICVFLFANGLPAILEVGPAAFLGGTTWKPTASVPQFGILPMIVGSIYVTAGAIVAGVPVGILTAIFLAFYCPKHLYKPLKSATELLAGIPSVVYGFFGLVLLVPFIREHIGGKGQSILAASILLGLMILPTIIGVSESARAPCLVRFTRARSRWAPTHEEAIFRTVLPAAKSGVMAGVILGIGRAVGETMAVIMVVGNQARLPGIRFGGRAHTDRQHRDGDGLCGGPAPRSADCNRRGAVCIYPDHQHPVFHSEAEGQICRVMFMRSCTRC